MRKITDKITEQEIVHYLIHHADFFSRHTELLKSLYVQHERKGGISLVEAKLGLQQERIEELEEELENLSRIARHNEQMFYNLLPLQQKFNQAEDFDTACNVLNEWTQDLGLKLSKIFLINDAWIDIDQIAVTNRLDRKAFEVIRLERFGLRSIYLGRLNPREKSLLFLPDELPVGSTALCLLKSAYPHKPYTAVVLFAAHAEEHFYQAQETTFLLRFMELLSQHIWRWIDEKDDE
ncbi:DUF484 family protein [Mergibacter septicus]|uniref:DUF484 family protein n=1 Tax=Mergibacter septicus TaxID=221402 RepID=UPI0011793488|nr:DUF484 family protein [Mergibacter septicus]AWX13230.1 DUF484 family protein [Mergibacter septicus]